MARQHWFAQRVSLIHAAFVALSTLVFVAANRLPTTGAELAEQAHSLRTVPADTAFYSSSLRLKEQWDAFVGSKAYSKLMEIPLIQLVKTQVSLQWQQSASPKVAKFRDYVQSLAGQDAVAVLKEMFSDELYVYGGSDITQSLKLFVELNSIRRTARFEAMAKGEDANQVTVDRAMEALEKHAADFKIPTVVFGFRIKDQERAKRELNEVHSLIRNALDEEQSVLAAHLQRDQIAGHEFVTLRLDGSMLPWDKIREAAHKLDDEQFEKLREAITNRKLTVALGVVDEFVLLSVGESTDHLEKMGQGPNLAEQPAIKQLQKHADQRLVSIGYVSKAFAQNLSSSAQTTEDLAGAAEEILVGAKVAEEDRKIILDDIRGLNLARYMPEAGDAASVGYLTARGYEGFHYNWGKRPMMDSSKPLTILSHVGGNPILLIATRSKDTVEDYAAAVSWLKQFATHVEKVVEEKADPDDWAKYQQFRDRGIALLERLDQATREHLYPALADGQAAFVMDFAAKSKQWFDKMPESPKPLPMLELAFVASVSDAERLRQGVAAYIDVARDAFKLLKEIHPDDVPDVKLPPYKASDLADGGKLYSYPLPKEWGVDPQVSVNAGLTDTFAVVSTMPATTERLLRETSPDLDTSLPLDRPAAVVTHVEFARLIDATRPWIDYGLDVAMGKLKPPKHDDGDNADDSKEDQPAQPSPMMIQMGFIVPQIHQFLDVAAAIRSASSVTYEENSVWITHSETHIEDLK